MAAKVEVNDVRWALKSAVFAQVMKCAALEQGTGIQVVEAHRATGAHAAAQVALAGLGGEPLPEIHRFWEQARSRLEDEAI